MRIEHVLIPLVSVYELWSVRAWLSSSLGGWFEGARPAPARLSYVMMIPIGHSTNSEMNAWSEVVWEAQYLRHGVDLLISAPVSDLIGVNKQSIRFQGSRLCHSQESEPTTTICLPSYYDTTTIGRYQWSLAPIWLCGVEYTSRYALVLTFSLIDALPGLRSGMLGRQARIRALAFMIMKQYHTIS